MIDEARRHGHEVIACTRRPGLLADVDELTTIVAGDASDPARVRRGKVTSAYPVVGDRPRLPMWVLRRLLRTAYADVARMEQIVAGSNLDWTIARLNRLIDMSPPRLGLDSWRRRCRDQSLGCDVSADKPRTDGMAPSCRRGEE